MRVGNFNFCVTAKACIFLSVLSVVVVVIVVVVLSTAK